MTENQDILSAVVDGVEYRCKRRPIPRREGRPKFYVRSRWLSRDGVEIRDEIAYNQYLGQKREAEDAEWRRKQSKKLEELRSELWGPAEASNE